MHSHAVYTLRLSRYEIREELVLKIAILAEKFVSDYTWYVDVILKLIRIAGDHVAEEVLHRVTQIIINRQDVQVHRDVLSALCLILALSREWMANRFTM